MAKRLWSSLSPAYKKRLASHGVTARSYNSGKAKDIIKEARGHKTTPERPKQAFRNPDQYPGYLRKREASGKYVPEGTLPAPRSGGYSRTDEDNGAPDIGSEIGWSGRDALNIITFYRTPGGATDGSDGLMVVTNLAPDGTVRDVQQMTYHQSEIFDLMDLAKSRGYQIDVQSLSSRDSGNVIG
jgi:hypothetical protein